jgi:HK97 family phage portal protein
MPRRKISSDSPPPKKPRAPRAAKPADDHRLRGLDALAPQYWGIEPLDKLTASTAIRVTAILACVRFIAQSVACMPLRVMIENQGRKAAASEIPCYGVLTRQPNPWQSTYDWIETSCYHTALYGNAFSRIVPGERGFCSQLWPLHPSRMIVKRMSDNSLEYTYLNAFGSQETYNQSEIVHFRWLSDNSYLGQMPADLCGTSVSLARKLDIAASAFWDNSARPDIVLETKDKIPEEGVNSLRAQWRDSYGGPRNRGKTAILPKNVSAKTLEGNSMESSQHMEMRASIVTEVARAYGVPATLIGDQGAMKWSTVEQEFISAQVFCLLPWQHRIEGPIDRSILRTYGDNVWSKLDNRGLLRADSAGRSALYQTLFNLGSITPNEIRDLEDLPLLDDPAADETYMQLGFSTLGAAAAQGQPVDPAQEVPAPAPDMPTDLPADAAGTMITGGDDVILG